MAPLLLLFILLSSGCGWHRKPTVEPVTLQCGACVVRISVSDAPDDVFTIHDITEQSCFRFSRTWTGEGPCSAGVVR